MKHILQYDPEREGAIGHLVQLMRDRLLKIRLPPKSEIYARGFRTNATDLKEQLQKIITKARKDENYLFSGADRTKVPLPDSSEQNPSSVPQPLGVSSLSPGDVRGLGQLPIRSQKTAINMRREYTNKLQDTWKTINDHEFVQSILAGEPHNFGRQDLCLDCKAKNILSPKIEFEMDQLKINSINEDCDLCELVYTAIKDIGLSSRISLVRSGNHCLLNETDQKVLRLCYGNPGKHHCLAVS